MTATGEAGPGAAALNPRAALPYLDMTLAELQRLASHLAWVGFMANDIGAMSVLLYVFEAREEVLRRHHAVQRCLRPLKVINPFGVQKGVKEITLNGRALIGNVIPVSRMKAVTAFV